MAIMFETLKKEDSESDVEQKILYPLLTDILGYDSSEIKTKDYLAPTDIDKGAGKKVGYYPDYVIYLGGLPVLIVEAKDPSTKCAAGYREARLYATEINKRYSEDHDPAVQILACNGQEIIYGPWNSEEAAVTCEVNDLSEGSAAIENLRILQGRKILIDHANKIRSRLTPFDRYKPLKMIGGPARQNEVISPNTFSAELAPLLRKYFDPDETAHSLEIIEKAYCSSQDITKYNATLESLLKDRIPSQDSFSDLSTTKKRAELVDGALKLALDQNRDVPDPFIMLVGSVGAGKSMFIERYLKYLIDDDVRENTLWIIINFNKAGSDLDNLEEWICSEFIETYRQQSTDDEPFSFDKLEKFFSPDIASRKAGPYQMLYKNDRTEYERRLTDDIVKWFDDPIKLASSIIRFYAKDCNKPVVVVFDNVDRRERDQQLSIFQSVQWFRHRNKCFTLLSLRDETFDAYKNEPPLDAFLKPFAFRITAPRFLNVIKKRLELALGYLTQNASKTQEFTLKNGVTVTYPSDNIGRYLMSIYIAIFHPQRSIRLMLEALSGRNIRRALEMFTDILMSGYLTDERLFSLSEGSTRTIPEWLIIRVLMRSNYRYYASDHGYIANIFDLPEESTTANNFLVLETIEYLASNRKKRTGFKLEGYFHVPHILEHLMRYGYSYEDIMWALETALNHGLIVADHQRDKNITAEDYIKISASGYYHLRFLSTRSEYLSNVILDTYLSDREIAKRITHIESDRFSHSQERIILLSKYIVSERDRYSEAFPEYAEEDDAVQRQIHRVEEAIEFISSTKKSNKNGQKQLL